MSLTRYRIRSLIIEDDLQVGFRYRVPAYPELIGMVAYRNGPHLKGYFLKDGKRSDTHTTWSCRIDEFMESVVEGEILRA